MRAVKEAAVSSAARAGQLRGGSNQSTGAVLVARHWELPCGQCRQCSAFGGGSRASWLAVLQAYMSAVALGKESRLVAASRAVASSADSSRSSGVCGSRGEWDRQALRQGQSSAGPRRLGSRAVASSAGSSRSSGVCWKQTQEDAMKFKLRKLSGHLGAGS